MIAIWANGFLVTYLPYLPLVNFWLFPYNLLTGHAMPEYLRKENTVLATHKELSNFTHRELSQYTHLQLKVYHFKASLTPEQANISVSQAVANELDKLYDQHPEAPKPKNYVVSVILEALLVAASEKLATTFIDQALKLIHDFLSDSFF